jgi:hypothetical protein
MSVSTLGVIYSLATTPPGKLFFFKLRYFTVKFATMRQKEKALAQALPTLPHLNPTPLSSPSSQVSVKDMGLEVECLSRGGDG